MRKRLLKLTCIGYNLYAHLAIIFIHVSKQSNRNVPFENIQRYILQLVLISWFLVTYTVYLWYTHMIKTERMKTQIPQTVRLQLLLLSRVCCFLPPQFPQHRQQQKQQAMMGKKMMKRKPMTMARAKPTKSFAN